MEKGHCRTIPSMGAVFLARQVKLDRQVALKILPLSLAANANRLARFQREQDGGNDDVEHREGSPTVKSRRTS